MRCIFITIEILCSLFSHVTSFTQKAMIIESLLLIMSIYDTSKKHLNNNIMKQQYTCAQNNIDIIV